MRTIAIVNQKGGCGKTTTAINLAAVFAERGIRTVLVDMDPQAHCAAGLGVPESQIEYSIAEALLADHSANFDPEPLIWEVARNLYLLPSTMRLTALEAPGGGLHQLPDKDRRLESLLRTIGRGFDCCLIDCPPTIGLLTFNALRAAREALVPVETGFFAMKGAQKQWNTIQKTIQHIGRPIACHLLPTLHKPEMKTAQDILASLRRDFAGQIIPIVINEHNALREAASFGQPVLEYAPQSAAHENFEKLADWLEEHRPDPQVQIEVMATGIGRVPSAATGPARAPAERAQGTTAARVPDASSAPAGPGSLSSRAAELARRVRDRTLEPGSGPAGPDEPSTAHPPSPHAPPLPAPPARSGPDASPAAAPAPPGDRDRNGATPIPPAEVRPLVEEIAGPGDAQAHPAAPGKDGKVSHLYGIRQTSQGVLFVQPAGGVHTMFVAGDFNRWSGRANPLRYNSELDVYQTIIDVEPGSYQYRLIVDGRWQSDPYNPQQARNEYGEPNSVLTVERTEASPQP